MQMRSVQYFTVEQLGINKRVVLHCLEHFSLIRTKKYSNWEEHYFDD